jgi:hypothetical protein
MRDEVRLRWLLNDLFTLFERARAPGTTSIAPEDALDGTILDDFLALEERAIKLGVKVR